MAAEQVGCEVVGSSREVFKDAGRELADRLIFAPRTGGARAPHIIFRRRWIRVTGYHLIGVSVASSGCDKRSNSVHRTRGRLVFRTRILRFTTHQSWSGSFRTRPPDGSEATPEVPRTFQGLAATRVSPCRIPDGSVAAPPRVSERQGPWRVIQPAGGAIRGVREDSGPPMGPHVLPRQDNWLSREEDLGGIQFIKADRIQTRDGRMDTETYIQRTESKSDLPYSPV